MAGTQSSTYLNVSPLNLIFTSGQGSNTNNIGNYIVVNGTSYAKSIFNNSQVAFFPIGLDPNTGNISNTQTDLHTDDEYDISTVSIINYTSKYPSMQLKPSDFAYLKNMGVYPNNRLMVARRFAGGITDDLTQVKNAPMATLVSWIPDDRDFIDFSFGEEWTDADANLENILNDLGKEAKITNLGGAASGGFGAVSLPGMFEGLQYQVFKNLGISNLDPNNLPLGNPNLVREAMMRKTLDKKASGSGLTCKFEIDMEVEFEQKFIQGLDPTLVYFDIVQNLLSFGTSEAQFQFSNGFGAKASDFVSKLTSGQASMIEAAVSQFISALIDAFQKLSSTILDAVSGNGSTNSNQNNSDGGVTGFVNNLMNANSVTNIITSVVSSTIGKYKVRILGVINSITGAPSGPWHITIGNPKRPFMTSGDMIVKNVRVTFGPTLTFNDLPSTIKAIFKLKSARNLGAQEIFRKFNSGRGRSYKKIDLSYIENSTINVNGGNSTNPTSQQTSTVLGTASFTQNSNTNSQSNVQQNQNAQNIQNSFNRQGQSGSPTQISNQNNGINQPSAQNSNSNSGPGVQPINDPSSSSMNTLQTRLNFLNSQPSLTPSQKAEQSSIQSQITQRTNGGFGGQNQQIINQSN